MPDMRLYKSKNTKLEVEFRKLIFAKGFRYKLHDKTLPGKPDLVFPKFKAVIFIHGCFWHNHNDCKYASIPKSQPEFWKEKFSRNVENHRKSYLKLKNDRWRVLTVWECAIKHSKEFTIDELLDFIECWLISSAASCEISGSEPLPILALNINSDT
ncbi:very short patch repair endonuclease [Vibrio parahaemolyticus]|uniref:very short patch repair endonuclease n=1 Tax=Vibrio parahaemolyticus TaxID=670 RepID=UPI00111F7CB0|nr:DNA mismatch endonuclease Vsr [Vibrio parahaemolyticus]TNZ84453.1 very short patch repair endonuclease [Vibrio parahaemolyticus]